MADLLGWATREGASTAAVCVGPSGAPHGGQGLLAVSTLSVGAEAFRCPCNMVLSASAALTVPTMTDVLALLAKPAEANPVNPPRKRNAAYAYKT